MALTRGGLTPAWPAVAAAGDPGFAELFAAMPVAALVLGPDGCIVHANLAAEHLLNLSERSMRGLSLRQVIVPPAGHSELRDGHGFAVYEAELPLARGGRIRADYLEAPVGDHADWRIVTLHAAPASHVQGDTQAGARAAIGAAAMLAHEIKNPLSGIRGAAQLLDGGELSDLIIAEVDRVTALIDRMQDFTDDRARPLRPTNIYPLLAHARRVAEAGFARGMMIEERFDPSLPPVPLDEDAFVQILINLLKNAAEAVADIAEPRIVIATAYRHGVSVGGGERRVKLPIEVAVIDNGPGAPPDIAAHLFEPFVSGKREGRGLGLPLVEKLVAEMGGLVRYDRTGEPPATAFRLLLPRGDE